MVNNTQNKHKSNHQSGSKNKKNRQAGKNKKSYIRTNPQQQVSDENRLKRVAEEEQKRTGKKDNESGNSSNLAKKGNDSGNSSNSAKKGSESGNSSNTVKKGSGNGNASANQSKSKGKPSSGQSTNGNGKKFANDGKKSQTGAEHEVNHKEQSGKFETAFNRIHKALKEMVKGTDSDAFVELLYSGYKNHSLVRKYKSELHQFAKLRNAIVHERVNADYYIAEPHIEVVERIEEIAREFEKPQTALSIATSPVFYYYEDAYLKDVLKVINKFDFTRFPVYDKDDKYVALLTSTEIIQWMAKHFSDSVVHFEDVRVKELLTKGKNYFVTFVDEDASLYHIEELFERYHTRGKKLQAVIITETGDRHGKPIGVITPWDLLDSDPED